MVGYDAAGATDGVEHEQEVKAARVGHGRGDLGGGKGGEIVEGEVDAKEEEEGTNGVEGILEATESSPLNQGAGLAGGHAGLEEEIAKDEGDELDEADGAEGPREAGAGDEEAGDEGEYDAASSAAAGADADGEGSLGGEVGGQGGDGGAKDEAVGEAHADALGEEELGVGGGEGGGEDAENLEGGTGHEDGAEVAGVGDAAGQGADGEEEEDLDGADPGDGGRGHVEDLGVVGLEYAKGIDEAPVCGVRLLVHDAFRAKVGWVAYHEFITIRCAHKAK